MYAFLGMMGFTHTSKHIMIKINNIYIYIYIYIVFLIILYEIHVELQNSCLII